MPTQIADDTLCQSEPCGGSASPLMIGVGVSMLVGLALATLWPGR